MIMVLMGGTAKDRDAVVRDLMQLYRSRIQCVNVAHVPSPDDRVARLQLEISPRRDFRAITLVNNPTSVVEVEALRRLGAFFVHLYGPLASIYGDITVESTDLYVAPIPFRERLPAHVLTPEEAVSQCQIRARNKVA